jgi:hypothetical protein
LKADEPVSSTELIDDAGDVTGAPEVASGVIVPTAAFVGLRENAGAEIAGAGRIFGDDARGIIS